jgi:hypothetical protein
MNAHYMNLGIDTMRLSYIMNLSRQQTDKQTRRHIMTDLINKLSKVDQRAVKLAMMHINYGNKDATIRVIDGMVRAANNRSESTLKAIRAAL